MGDECLCRTIKAYIVRNPSIIPRELDIPLKTNSIVSIIGPRRSGKTYMMYYTILKLLDEIPINNILYVDFEDERIRNLDANDLNDMLKVFYMILKPYSDKPKYLFLDEVHVVRDWDKWVRRIYDTREYHIYISGSSSKLLSREISTSLRGRSIDYVIFPFSFREFLKVKGYNIGDIDLLTYLEERGRVIGFLNEYIRYGGYPEVVLEKNIDIKFKLIQSYYNAVFYRDIIGRYGVRYPALLDIFIRYCISSHSKYISISKIYRYVKTLGYKVSKAKLIDYLKYVEDVYLLFPVEIFSYSIKDRKQYPRKIYVIDTGLINALDIDTNMGRLLENLVYIELLRRSKYKNDFQIYYWRDRQQREVDFVIIKGIDVKELIQVSYASSYDEVNKREINGLLKAGKELGCRNLKVITWDYDDIKEYDNLEIVFEPIWKWLLKFE